MARPRKPTKVLELTGALRKNPQRRRERAQEPTVEAPLGPPPERLGQRTHRLVEDPALFGALCVEAWHELQSHAPWLTAADRVLLETLAVWVAEDWLGLLPTQLVPSKLRALGMLGLTPADRSKVKAPPEAPKRNPFMDLAG